LLVTLRLPRREQERGHRSGNRDGQFGLQSVGGRVERSFAVGVAHLVAELADSVVSASFTTLSSCFYER
jgi:hypothetical protein